MLLSCLQTQTLARAFHLDPLTPFKIGHNHKFVKVCSAPNLTDLLHANQQTSTPAHDAGIAVLPRRLPILDQLDQAARCSVVWWDLVLHIQGESAAGVCTNIPVQPSRQYAE